VRFKRGDVAVARLANLRLEGAESRIAAAHGEHRVESNLVRALAAGEFDSLAGRYLHAEHDPPAALRARMQQILDDDLNVIRLRR